jgi:hypothetical protein
MSLPALWQLADQYRQLERLADSEDLPPEVIADTLESLTGDITVKATNVAKFAQNLEYAAKAIDEAAVAMSLRAARFERRAEALRRYLLVNMQASGITKIEATEFTLAIRKNPAAVVIDDEAAIPPAFMVTPPPPAARPDKKAIAAALKSDAAAVPGARLDQSERLEIRS